MRIRSLATTLAAGLLAAALAACTPPGDRYVDAPRLAPEGGRAALAAADFSRARTVEVVLSEFAFAPDRLRFIEGEPYRLVLRNEGSDDHSFSAPEFFASIAVRAVVPEPVGDTAALTALAVPPGGERAIEFVAMTPGVYPLVCERPLHAPAGMTGEIRIAAK